NYLDVTDMLPGGHNQGMVTDAQWADMDRDGRPDLVVCGEWMPLLVFRNTPSGFKKTEVPHATGLWNCLHIADYDGDGDPDIAAGNLGLNSNLRASVSEPLGLWVKDFDGNGSVDPVLTYYRQEHNYVFADKDVLVNQLPVLKKRFVEYRKYAESDFDAVFPPQLREGTLSLKAETLASCIVLNEGNDHWTLRPLPLQAQFSPVFAITSGDFDGDGHADLLLGGNYYEVQPAIGRFDASYGTFLRGDGTGQYHPVPLSESPFWLPGPVRSIERLNGPGGRKRLMVARNDGS
ncbi:MAG: VCBS repeat-containing protein, partial [Saprospiraceae bacterium]|nr:VCBS repeat-containing protein [Saprospiraceae bacterium]